MYADALVREECQKLWLQRNGKKKGFYSHKSNQATEITKVIRKIPDVDSVPPLDEARLDKIYSAFLDHLALSRMHQEYFRKEGWSDPLISASCVRSLPEPKDRKRITKKLIGQFESVKGVPGFYLDQYQEWTFCGKNGILIPLKDYLCRTIRLRIRLDQPEKDEKGKEKNKYKKFSYYYEKTEDGRIYNAYEQGCRAGSHIGFYYSYADDFSTVYITEGEKKSILSNHVLHHPVISLPGTNFYALLFQKQASWC